jgi:hypothetical protein
MRGGAQSHLMRCESKAAPGEESYYVVKFQNNPQGTRILANELLGTRLAARMGLPGPVSRACSSGLAILDHRRKSRFTTFFLTIGFVRS